MRGVLLSILVLVGCKESRKMPSSSMMPTIGIGERFKISRTNAVEHGDMVVFRQPCEPDREYVKRVIGVGGDTVEVRCGTVYVNGKAIPATLVAEHTTYKDQFDDGSDSKEVERPVSRWREDFEGKSYEIFDADNRVARAKDPDAPAFGSKDFPLDEPPSCASQFATPHGTANAFGKPGEPEPAPLGKIVETKPMAKPCEVQKHFVVPEDTLFMMGDNRDNSNDSRFWGVVPLANVVGTVD